MTVGCPDALGGIIYDSIPAPYSASNGNLPPVAAGLASLPFAATQTAEIGDYVHLAPGSRTLTDVVVTLVTQAQHSDFPALDPDSWGLELRLNLYSVDKTGADPGVGGLIYSATQQVTIPWLPELGAGTVLGGLAFNVDVAIPDVQVPDDVIFGAFFSTGTGPAGVPGPADMLAVGLHGTSPGAPIAIGNDVEPDAIFWNTSNNAYYADGGAGGVGVFRRATGWSPYTPSVKFIASDADDPAKIANPEPAGITLVGLGVLGIVACRRRKQRV